MTDTFVHPRRTPPKDVKMIAGHKRQKLSHSPETRTAAIDPSAAIAQIKSQDSGSDQSASRWFNNVNEHVPASARNTTTYDDEPPFFMSNQNNYLPGTFAASETSKLFGAQSRLDSENEELRSVIDDLTIENRKLKHFLRSTSKSHQNSPSVDGRDKLFEVRMHGLSSEKRRELEFLLKNFATSVHQSAASHANSTSGSGVSSNGLGAQYAAARTDSGYASNSNSNRTGHMHSHGPRGLPAISQTAKDHSIKSYLHDIPDTLLPRSQPVVMNERAKMALVVRRLEQLFTGRNAAPGEHSQPLQQQEVSNMAARADAINSKKRKTEGSREAHILPADSKVNLDAIEFNGEKRKRPALTSQGSDFSEGTGVLTSRPGSPDQRPTRPLDLDIHRAQVAAENIEYIRHLGLQSPHLDSESSDDSWMYLNLLINMAQIHTINVTPEFVRKAIKKVSTKFELTKDGNRVRWIGGPEGTVFSKEEEKALEGVDNIKENNRSEDSQDYSGTGGSSKRSKTDSNSNAVVSNATPSDDKTSGLQSSEVSKNQISIGAASYPYSSAQAQQSQVGSAFDYKPIVYRGRMKTFTEESYLVDSDSSSGSVSRNSSALAHTLSRSNLNQQRNADEGLITFYNNPFFCSDYSGDKLPNNLTQDRDVMPGITLGADPSDGIATSASRLAQACYFTQKYGPSPFRTIPDEQLPPLELVPLKTDVVMDEEEVQPLDLACSGLGGIMPEDNFAVDVQVDMCPASSSDQLKTLHQIPVTGTVVKRKFDYKTSRKVKLELLPSRLPPPSYVFFTSSSSSGNPVSEHSEEESEESEESSSIDDQGSTVPAMFLQHWPTEEYNDANGSEYGEHDDSSMDMLAVARAADPIRIAEQERQYVINQPGGRVVAGSLAATVGASQSTSSVAGDAVSNASNQPEFDSDGDSAMNVDGS